LPPGSGRLRRDTSSFDTDRHTEYRRWLQDALNGEEPVALLEPVLAAVLRIATHPSIFRPPTPRAVVETFTDACLAAPAALALRAESRHWSIFRQLCRRADCRGNLVQDAYLAALAIEHQCLRNDRPRFCPLPSAPLAASARRRPQDRQPRLIDRPSR
jgi:toxin-antitoxin system PIN domain toxin